MSAPPDSTLVDRFRDDLDCLLPDARSGRIAVAVSGGPDSMALLALAAAALPGRTIAATIDHGLRTASAEECAMVAAECARLDVPHATLRPARPIAGASLQAQARAARYAALVEWARGAEATAILTAHHADDQAETFLMRAARGAGIAGLSGIRALRRQDGMAIARPLLRWRRAELRAIVRRARLPFVDDPANLDPRHDRTRFRRLLDHNEWLDPSHIAQSAGQLAEADADLAAITDWLFADRAHETDGVVEIDVAGLPRELKRRLTRRAIERLRSGTDAESIWHSGRNVETLLDSLDRGKRTTLAGVLASADGGIWRFRVAPPRRSA